MYSLLLFFFFPDLQGFACMMCTFPEMCILPSWVCSTQGVVGKDLTTVSPGGRVWFVELADFRGVNTQTIADFRLPIGSLSAELGRNMCNWLCKPVWAASAHPWLHLSAWIAALPGSLLWLQPAGHTHDTAFLSLPFCTLTYFSLSTSVSSSDSSPWRQGSQVFLCFWRPAQCLAHGCYLIRVYGMSKSSFPLPK